MNLQLQDGINCVLYTTKNNMLRMHQENSNFQAYFVEINPKFVRLGHWVDRNFLIM